MSTTTRLRPATTPAAPWLGAWAWAFLLVALLAAPWLGAVHAVVHAKVPAAFVAATAATTAIGVADTDPTPDLRDLFGEHSQEGDCRIYDQLSHSDGLKHLLSLPPVILPPVAVLAWHAGECLRRWAALFDARGPPSLV